MLNGPPAVNRLRKVKRTIRRAGPFRLSRINRGNNKQTLATIRSCYYHDNKLCRVFISTEQERSRLYESLVERFLLRATEYKRGRRSFSEIAFEFRCLLCGDSFFKW